ncbi:glycerate kinase [Catenisphaera adipataccumulans]|jgi:glycerate kinase|uniref:Glycerate kinase n=1 Tax=Catenisphaera adipataccumulans TaxID=700500 RepID=A0A7W8FVC3_9FIRM|nr:glycerate kinase [Catenisphaera adipataccumulans]MBB5183489.1 glycerate kinase [Catenisphaera adipataccumulans]
MKIVIASDSFKGSLSAAKACASAEKGILRADPNIQTACHPMADGGEGTADVFAEILHAERVACDTVDAYGQPLRAYYAYDGYTAVIDVASCIGLNLRPRNERNPMVASSRGVGILMKDALGRGCSHLIIGLGGSSTNDGGMGLLSEFGVTFYDRNRQVLEPDVYALNRIAYIDKSHFKKPDVKMTVACDVNNHLLGPEGATYVFGRQKGIYPNQMADIDRWMRRYRDKMRQTFHVNLDAPAGSGAAGGIGSVLLSIFHAKARSGIDVVSEYSGLEQDIQDCDWVFTGEGQTDAQTMYGKAVFGVLQIANRYNKPVLCLSGALGPGYEALYEAGMAGIFSSADRAMSFHQALASSAEKLEALAFSLTHMIERMDANEEK